MAAKLDLPEDLIGYFSLFLIRESVDGGVTCESVEMPSPASGANGPPPPDGILSLFLNQQIISGQQIAFFLAFISVHMWLPGSPT